MIRRLKTVFSVFVLISVIFTGTVFGQRNAVYDMTGVYEFENNGVTGTALIAKENAGLRLFIRLWEGQMDINNPYRDADFIFDGYVETNVTTIIPSGSGEAIHRFSNKDNLSVDVRFRYLMTFSNIFGKIKSENIVYFKDDIDLRKNRGFIEPFAINPVRYGPYNPDSYPDWSVVSRDYIFDDLKKEKKTGAFIFTFEDENGDEFSKPTADSSWTVNYDPGIGMDFSDMYENPPDSGSRITCWSQIFDVYNPYTGETQLDDFIIRCRY